MGWWDLARERIVVDAAAPANAQLRMLIHETAHALGVDYQRYSRPQAEVIVDTVTYLEAAGIGWRSMARRFRARCPAASRGRTR